MSITFFLFVCIVLLFLSVPQIQQIINANFIEVIILGFLSSVVLLVFQLCREWKKQQETKEVLVEELEENVRRINENFYWLVEKESVFHKSPLAPLFDRCFNAFLMTNGLTLLSKKCRRHLLYAQNGIFASNSHIWGDRECQSEIKKKTFITTLFQTYKEIRDTLEEMGKRKRWELVQYQRVNDGQNIKKETLERVRAGSY